MQCRVYALVMVAAFGSGCGPSESTAIPPQPEALTGKSAFPGIATQSSRPRSDSHVPASPRFVERHAALKVEFVYDNGADERALMVQSTGGGGAWIDFDRDGFPDLHCAQGGNPTASPAHPVGDRLFRNVEGTQFENVSPLALPRDLACGQGVAVGDFDNDGFDDLLISQIGPDTLLQNMGDGTFREVPYPFAGGHDRWSTSASLYDMDDDGDLDLFVCNYLRYDVFHPVPCRDATGKPFICHPEELDKDRSECYENLGDGAFRPVAEEWGLAEQGKALGVVVAHFNDDPWPDVFVANDTMANFLYLGTGPRRFQEQAVLQGCACNALGQYQANMGVACGDYDRNGYLDLYVTTFTDDSNTLFANLGGGGFRDVTRLEGLHAPTIDTLGFGTVMTDFNADGAMDLFMTNGHIDDWRDRGEAWKMPAELFSYGGRKWQKHGPEAAGEFLKNEFLGRAVSMGDFDRDGDTDLLVVHQGDPASILVNESKRGRWLQVELVGTTSNRRGIGAKVTVIGKGLKLTNQLVGGSSYLTTHEPLLHFGLGDYDGPLEVRVDWPMANVRAEVVPTKVDRRIRIVEGHGEL